MDEYNSAGDYVVVTGTTTYTAPTSARTIFVKCSGSGGGVPDAATNGAGGGGGYVYE